MLPQFDPRITQRDYSGLEQMTSPELLNYSKKEERKTKYHAFISKLAFGVGVIASSSILGFGLAKYFNNPQSNSNDLFTIMGETAIAILAPAVIGFTERRRAREHLAKQYGAIDYFLEKNSLGDFNPDSANPESIERLRQSVENLKELAKHLKERKH